MSHVQAQFFEGWIRGYLPDKLLSSRSVLATQTTLFTGKLFIRWIAISILWTTSVCHFLAKFAWEASRKIHFLCDDTNHDGQCMFFTMIHSWLRWHPQWQTYTCLWGDGLKIVILVIKWPFQTFKLMWRGDMAGWLEHWTWIWRLWVQFPFWPLASFVCSSSEFNSSVTLVNSQLVWLLPVGILNHVMFNIYLITICLNWPW